MLFYINKKNSPSSLLGSWLKSSVDHFDQNRCKKFSSYFLHSKLTRAKKNRCKNLQKVRDLTPKVHP